ncbi:putative DNA binding domain-containing protein [Leptolyngbya cf. ectocarpi LEGE 11479]|uniref:DNA binding domain-containing protein n=1 Tax=Leptolyngbya cf. ectocarpi LEGE 11479 TaxID=1828722 RepID=A0A928WZN4_LEPEC|nr:ATP-binding protein [Leptolyngbya ectocarpi]MBE9065181.1 putative DNA binding domain-containing protein [Leptolyngbya cf. ectocarpi LEGE 11479]
MAVDLETLNHWLQSPETEQLEFKEAKTQYGKDNLLRYCVALSNEGGGHLVLGVTDKLPRQVIGTQAFSSTQSLNAIKALIIDKLGFRVDVFELQHEDGRVLVFEMPPRPLGQARAVDGKYLMRGGEGTTGMTEDRLKLIFSEDQQDWFALPAHADAKSEDVIALLDTQAYFDLLQRPYPTSRDAVLDRLQSERFIRSTGNGWTITNLAAILLAKKLSSFPLSLARKAPRFVIYEGVNKQNTRDEVTGKRGYAVGFSGLVDFVHSAAPQNRFIEEIVREEVKMFPKQALRELIANALIHQDFQVAGSSVMIEMYSDRVEISNPGIPPIKAERFIDEYHSRNEQLADVMRRFGICEEKGSGIDKVIHAAEFFQLPAPDFRIGNIRTTVVLFAHQNFAGMSKSDRIRACYQHCCLLYVSNKQMSNKTLRERFRLASSQAGAVSNIIRATKDVGLIQSDTSDSASTRYARYLPFWA